MSARFQTTNWSLVLAARGNETLASRDALTRLCEIYWYPIYAFIRRKGHSAEQARDLTQGYFALLLEKAYLEDVRPEAGRFRSFLFASVSHFLSNERDRAHALKRGGNRALISLDGDTAEGRYRHEPARELTPEKLFERQWALALLDRALDRLGDEEAATGSRARFDQLRPYLTGEEPTAQYSEVAQALGMSEGAVRVAVHRMRGRFGKVLRQEIAHTVNDPADVDEELRFLLTALAG